MKFERVSREVINRERYPLSPAQWRSTGGRWLLTITPMLFGVRVQFGRADDPYGHELDYCCGPDPHQLMVVTSIVMLALERVDESIDTLDLQVRFPIQSRKPMSNDATCWARLCELADLPAFPISGDVIASAELAGSQRGSKA